MKNRNAFLETFRTKEGKITFFGATVCLIAFLCVSSFVPGDWQYKKILLMFLGLVMFAGCVVFTQIVGAVQNDIDKEEREAAQKAKHPNKKKK
jgi:multisubunit Na+/H+ antiporter MnhG subunit